jgi:hypothetical protein
MSIWPSSDYLNSNKAQHFFGHPNAIYILSSFTDMKNEIQESVDIPKAVKGANKFKGAEEPNGVLKGKILLVRCRLITGHCL